MFRKILLFAFVITCAEASLATRARLLSLQGGNLYNGAYFADHVIDEQSVFFYPSRIHALNPSVMFEMGSQGGDTTAGAEGGILKKAGDGRLFVYMGRDFVRTDIFGNDLRNGFTTQQNPLDVIYGKNDWAIGATLSMYEDKTATKAKEQTLVLRFGKELGNGGELFASADLISQTEKAAGTGTDKVTGAPYLQAGGNIKSGDYHWHGSINFSDTKKEVSGASSKVKDTNFLLGVEDRSLKATGSDLYYGTSLIYAQRDTEGKKATGMVMPLYIGVEYDMNSWAVLRGSVRQNFFLIGSRKNEVGTTSPADEPAGIPNDTLVATGLGFKYNKLQLDGTLAASTTGNINGSAVLASAGLVYYY